LSLLFVVFACVVLGAQTDSKSSVPDSAPTDEMKDLAAIKTVRLVTREVDNPKLPFYDYAKLLLENAGLRVVNESSKSYDATLTVSLTVMPLGAKYSPYGGFSGGTYYETASRISGDLTLTGASTTVIKRSFKA